MLSFYSSAKFVTALDSPFAQISSHLMKQCASNGDQCMALEQEKNVEIIIIIIESQKIKLE